MLESNSKDFILQYQRDKVLACKSCNVTVYNLNDPCVSGECIEKVTTYGIKKIPAVIVDGKIADCCISTSSTIEGLKAAGIGISF